MTEKWVEQVGQAKALAAAWDGTRSWLLHVGHLTRHDGAEAAFAAFDAGTGGGGGAALTATTCGGGGGAVGPSEVGV